MVYNYTSPIVHVHTVYFSEVTVVGFEYKQSFAVHPKISEKKFFPWSKYKPIEGI